MNAQNSQHDLRIITDRLRTEVIAGDVDPEPVEELLAQQNTDGSWPDIDYADRSRTHWKPNQHNTRLVTLASAYRMLDGPHAGSRACLDAIGNGLVYWTRTDPQCDNWFYNCISAPRELANVLLLVADDLPTDLTSATAQLVRRSGFTRTGANLVWETGNLLKLSCALGDGELLEVAAGRISDEIRYSTEEGIQADHSFHQHGPQNNIGSYGQSFALQVSQFAALLAGTRYAFALEKIRTLSGLILEGQQWFIWGQQVDFHAMGRRVFRSVGPWTTGWSTGASTSGSRPNEYVRICDAMAGTDPDRADEYRDFAARLKGEHPPKASGPLGNRHFWRSDTMIHRRNGFYCSVRTHSTRTRPTETQVNRENLRGYHLSDGVYFLMQRGDEFHGIQPVWNYRRLPGLTTIDTGAPFPYGRDVNQYGSTRFVGGVSDRLVGAAAMDYAKDEVRARKSWFFLDDGWVCLGAGISADSGERTITTLNQCLLKSEVTLLSDGKATTLRETRCSSDHLQGVHQDGVAYYFLSPAEASISAGPQTGSWTDIEENTVIREPVTRDVFTLWVDHGSHVSDAMYAYRVVPGQSREAFISESETNSVQILSNTHDCQSIAVPDQGLIQAVFYSPGGVVAPGELEIQASAPCLILLRQIGDIVNLSVADPTQELDRLKIRLSGKFEGPDGHYLSNEGRTLIWVDLPTDAYAGQSAQCILRRG